MQWCLKYLDCFFNEVAQTSNSYKKKRCTIEITDSFFSPLYCNEGIHEAIDGDYLDSYNLSLLNPYMVLSNFSQRFESFRVCGMKLNTWPRLCIMQPNLSASWLFQRAMSAKKQSNVPADFINELLYSNFSCMQVVYFSHDWDYFDVFSYRGFFHILHFCRG